MSISWVLTSINMTRTRNRTGTWNWAWPRRSRWKVGWRCVVKLVTNLHSTLLRKGAPIIYPLGWYYTSHALFFLIVSLFNKSLVFRTLPCYPLLLYVTTHCLTQVVLPRLLLFRPSLATLFTICIYPTSQHLRCVVFPPLSFSAIPHLYPTSVSHFLHIFSHIPFSHFIELLEVVSSSYSPSPIMRPPLYRCLNPSVLPFPSCVRGKLLRQALKRFICFASPTSC